MDTMYVKRSAAIDEFDVHADKVCMNGAGADELVPLNCQSDAGDIVISGGIC